MLKRSTILAFLTLCMACATLKAEDLDVAPVVREGTAWYDAANWDVEGQCWKDVERHFARCPARAKGVIPEGVWANSQHSAGLITRFRTDSTSISVKYKLYSPNLAITLMPATGVSGLDLYVLHNGKWCWVACTKPDAQEATQILVSGMTNEMKEYMLYYPLYNGIDQLEIGVPEEAHFFAMAPRKEKPVFYYGTSITNGGCVSRPGNAFTAMLGRRLDLPVINFGFAGSARMEPELAKLIIEMDPAIFVLDALPNMSPQETATRPIPFIQILRDAHPETPILLVEDRSFSNSYLLPDVAATHKARREGLKKAYEHFIALGDKNIYYLSAENLLGEQLDYDSTMDASHPNDLGMYRMTDSLEKVLRPILKK
ncbi:MAG: SGNH/GDSL hydrolase family protein [Planctomycetia bacterium]|nr:SGNH/GDSL hydrolase family protein [Planctomycetia bacterium]